MTGLFRSGRRPCHAILVAAAAVLSGGSSAMAQNLFTISGTSNGSAIAPVGADNLIDLVTEAVNNESRFAGLANTTASLSLNYGGIANAISIDKNAANTFATLTFINSDGTRTTRTFDTTAPGANGRSLENLVEDYLKKDGSDDLKEFFKAVNAQSVIGVSDGNPNATTARMASYAYDRFGRFNRQTGMWTLKDDTDGKSGAGLQFRVGASGGAFEAGDFDGETAMLQTSLDWNFSKYVGASLGTFAGYNSIGDADVFHVGINFGIPIRPVLPTESLPLTWQITPNFTLAGSGSEDIGAGGLVYSGALTSLLRWDINSKLSLELANQIGFYEGQSLSFDDYELDPGVSQQILKNGLEAQYLFSESGWYVYGGASYTNFLEDAAVEGWLTPSIGIGWRKSTLRGTGFEIGFVGDYGDDYNAYGGRASFNFAF